jgi:hypothetical protein
MKFLPIIASCLLLFMFAACTSSTTVTTDEKALNALEDKSLTKEEKLLIGKWKLTLQENRAVAGEKIDYTTQKIEIITKFEPNGYFEVYDTFLDPNYVKSGLPKIQSRSKGQWELNKSGGLTLEYLGSDTKRTEKLIFDKITDAEMTVHGAEKNVSIYKSYKAL